MPPTGDGERGVLVVAEAPGENEDKRGIQLIGEAGQIARFHFKELGWDLDKHCRKTNAVCCRPPDNRTPAPEEVDACRKRLWTEIETFRPHIIIPMGQTAIESLILHRFKGGRDDDEKNHIGKWRGWAIPDQELKAWICPTYHPSALLYNKDKLSAWPTVFQQDLAQAFSLVETPVPDYGKETDRVTVLYHPAAIETALTDLLAKAEQEAFYMAFDYETSGKKPHAPGHFIRTVAFSLDGWSAIAFPLWDKTVEAYYSHLVELWVQVLQHPNIHKIAANMVFEEKWSRFVLGTRVESWGFDTLLGAHCGDNRSGITGLKFQAFVQYGVVDYSSEIEGYLRAKEDDGGNAFNRIADAPLDRLLLYNGMDAMLEYRLAMDQMEKLGIV